MTMNGALASATIYTLLLFVILVCNRESVKRAIQALMPQALQERCRFNRG